MKEIKDIIEAFDAAVRDNKLTALATVVKVEGSSYRRPGARMLVTEDGMLTGAISGGCLEGDALRKAVAAITQEEKKLVVYDTTDEDDLQFGVQLGCNGIVHILFEPLIATERSNPVELLRSLLHKRENAVLVTMFSEEQGAHPGTCLVLKGGNIITALPDNFTGLLLNNVRDSFNRKYSSLNNCTHEGKSFQAFIEFIPPPIKLLIAGAGNDVMPIVDMAAVLGWHTIVADGRFTHATQKRFPKAESVIVSKAEELLSNVSIDMRTAVVLMTHNYHYDLAVLKILLPINCGYIGVLGPKKKLAKMFDDLSAANINITREQKNCIHGPTGLNIGAETSEEIALSILAEIKAVLTDHDGAPLKDIMEPIHGRSAIDV